MIKQQTYRAAHLMQWNTRLCNDIQTPLTDKVVEAVLHHQGISFEHSDEYRNLYSYDKLWEQLEHYDRDYELATNEWIQSGLQQAFRIFARPKNQEKLKTVKLTEEAAVLFASLSIKGDKSAGLTAYGETKFDAFSVGLDKAVSILEAGKAPAPCLSGVRTQRKGKTRLVWMYPLEMTILEAVIARPLVDYFKAAEHVMTFGDFSHEVGMRMRRSASNTKYHYSLDYSQFDSTVKPLVIRYAFNAFRSWFDLDDEVYHGVSLSELFDIVERYLIYTPIVMPMKGSKYPVLVTGKRGGVPSGSYFTQMIDSFQNVALIMACDRRFQLGIKDDNLYVLGDDCLFFCNKALTGGVAQISYFLSNYGFKLNPSKGSHGLSTVLVSYLGRDWRNGFPVRKFSDITRGALYPEKYRRYSPERGKRMQQALNVINSYLLTSYIEDSPVGVEKFGTSYMVTPWTTSGLTRYLMDEGLIPGNVLKRVIY